MRRPGRARGQALVVALLVLTVACVAVVTTVHLGSAIRDRVELQDAADAAAVSLATLEARSFNLYAYANRSQASHYVSAMLLQSLLSFLYFNEAFLTDVYGVLRTLDPCAGGAQGAWRAVCAALDRVPVLGPALRVLSGVLVLFEGLVATYQGMLEASGIDARLGSEAIPALRTAASAMAHVSSAVMTDAAEHLRSGGKQVLEANGIHGADPRASALSLCLFDRAHVREANGSPLAPNLRPGQPLDAFARGERDRIARAKRTMAQIANASRYACDGGNAGCRPGFATARTAALLAPPRGGEALGALMATLPKWGQTRMLTHGLGRGVDPGDGANFLREPGDAPGAGMAMLAQGEVLGSDDVYALRLGPAWLDGVVNPLACDAGDDRLRCWGEPNQGTPGDRPFRFALKTSIWAGSDDDPFLGGGGLHWRVAHRSYPLGDGWAPPNAPGLLGALGLNAFTRVVAGLSVVTYVANVRGVRDGHHPWRGVAPFMHFEAGGFRGACGEGPPNLDEAAGRRGDFNQPSVWVALERRAGERMASLLGREGRLDVGAASLRLTAATPMRVLARAQAYYHRPDTWAEAPNFFNPYWRARLAPVWQGRDVDPDVAALIAALPEALRRHPQKVLTH